MMINSMGFLQSLYCSNVNPSNKKSRTLPLLNIKDKYGRTFHLSWIGFFVAFLSWFAFPLLIHDVVKKDLQLTQTQIANSSLIALLATLLVRLIVGPLCDRYGPRLVMVGCLITGAIPTALTPLIKNATGLMIIRFFIGILGGTFVPCQVWTSLFFDQNIVGFTNALAAGWGNAGGGLTFYLMPTLVSSLIIKYDLGQYWAWRLAFPLSPCIIILGIAIVILLFGHDTPTGDWNNRHSKQDIDVQGAKNADKQPVQMTDILIRSQDEETSGNSDVRNSLINPLGVRTITLEDEISRAPTSKNICQVALSMQTLLVALSYLCSFGSELAVEGIISGLYIQTAKVQDGIMWNYQQAGNWAALFGLLSIFTRPLGGYIADIVYRYRGISAKKWWLIFLGAMNGILCICIGFAKLKIYSLIGATTGLAIFMEAANGAIFALVPVIHPKFNGIVSGVTGAAGNLGGILFNFVFLYFGSDYHKALWIIGIICFASNLAMSCIPVRSTKKTVTILPN